MKKKRIGYYKNLMKVQKLIKMQNEAELASSYGNIMTIEEENSYLLSFLQGKETSDFIGPFLISHRLENNRIREEGLEVKIEGYVKNLVQSSRRYDFLKDKAQQSLNKEERNRFAVMIQEYIASRHF